MTRKQKEFLSVALFFLAICFIIFLLQRVFAPTREANGGQVHASWTEAPEPDLKEYWIERKSKRRGSWSITQRPARGTSQTILVGIDGKPYWWRIRAIDFSGNVGGPSNVVYHKFPRKKKGRNK